MANKNGSVYKRRWGDRRDGRMVKAPGLQTIMSGILPNRTDCEVHLHDTFDCTELLAYIEEKNAQHPDYKTTIFHCIITALARMVVERPKMNYFIQACRMYERNEISISFVAKRRFTDGGEEALMVLKPKMTDTVDDVSRFIVGDVTQMRKSEHSTGGIDAVIDNIAKMPRLMLMAFLQIVRWLDYWGLNPDILTDGDPNYTTILCSNLGSIKCPAVYHHLNNYGTNSIMVTIGAYHQETVLMPDGSCRQRTMIDIGATLDERIADGFYFARSLKLLKYIMANPSLLDRPIGESSGFDYN